MKTSIEFVNHASIIVSDGNISILSDPWYTGDAFHKGWNLLHETSDDEVEQILDKVTHIWLSHEHPDHFSITFFRNFAEKIKRKSIKILFQKTKDKRVKKFFDGQGLEVSELDFNCARSLSENFSITCIKDGFYDSGLLIESHSEKILNLNDCEITTPKRAAEVFKITGEVDVLLTQFSFAAWKGGKENKKWRKEAALEKIKTIGLQIEKFKPNFVVPFASFIYFSNEQNFYLNDAINRPEQLIEAMKQSSAKIIIMAPNDVFNGELDLTKRNKSINFWKRKYDQIRFVQMNRYEKIEFSILQVSFQKYCQRIQKNNNITLIKIIRNISPLKAFKPVVIRLSDYAMNFKVDYVTGSFKKTEELAMLSMTSESLNFIFNNSFGFDTLTVNGCFEEERKNGFLDATKTLAIENLNNLGINIEIKTLFNIPIIKLFLSRLYRVTRRLDL